MRTDAAKKGVIKVASQEQQENFKNTRRTLRVLQQAASDKENLVGRPKIDKDVKLASDLDKDIKRKIFVDKTVQTEDKITADDLTSSEPSESYWQKLAEKRGEMLEEYLKENHKLKEDIEALQEENKICKDMLEESKALVEVLQEMIGVEHDTSTEDAEEATEETV